MKRTVFIITLALTTWWGVAYGSPQTLWQQTGFDQPESVVLDVDGSHLYVSNINGEPGEKNGLGYISKLEEDGHLLEKRWVSGLNAPKGMGVYEGKLFVTDVDRFLVIELASGEVVKELLPPEAKFLNDVTVTSAGDVYVSDMMGNAIYHFNGEELSLWLKDERLMHPNGVMADGDSLLVAGWGAPIAADFSTEEAGSLMRIGFEEKQLTTVAGGKQLGNLDGVVRVGDSVMVNDWMNGRLFRITSDGDAVVAAELDQGVADIGAANDVIFLPYMFDGMVRAVRIP